MSGTPRDIYWRVEWYKKGFGWLLAASFTLPHDSTAEEALDHCRAVVPFYATATLRAGRGR